MQTNKKNRNLLSQIIQVITSHMNNPKRKLEVGSTLAA